MSRHTAGLAALMVLSALVIPVWLWIAHTHRTHWAPAVEGDYWDGFVLPWSTRIWLFMMLTAASGWAAGSAMAQARFFSRWLHGLVPALAVGVVVTMGVIPAWAWMVELGLATFSKAVESLVSSVFMVVVAAATASLTSLYSNLPTGTFVGSGAGGLGLWMLWGGIA